MKTLTGFRDFYPEERARRAYIERVWRRVARSYGFVEYDGPPLEELELFTRKSGAEIISQLYNFVDKGGREVALRPEMTPTLARMAAARQRDYRKPLRWFAIPQVFRYERPQKGRLREHFQFNCDIIGEAGAGADAELVALLIETLRAFGFGPDEVVVRVSDRMFWSQFLDERRVPEEDRYAIMQAIDKSEREPREKTALALGALADDVLNVLDHGASWEPIDALLAELDARGLGGYAKRDLTIVRGLAYYTGIVFEAFDRRGENRAIGAGGRYDNLLGALCGVDLPALGFGMGDVVLGNMIRDSRTANALMEKEASADLRPDVWMVVADELHRMDAQRLAADLRALGLSVVCPLAPAKVGRQFQDAEAQGARLAIVAGTEWPEVTIKTLATREERRLAAADVPRIIAGI